MKCQRCGQCCTSASIALVNIPVGGDKQELGEWLEHHHCQIETIDMPNGPVLGVRIPLMCKHIVYDHNGIATCKIYERRPVICKDFWCRRVKG